MTYDAKSLSDLGAPFLALSHSVASAHTGTGSDLWAVVVVLVRKVHRVDPVVAVAYGSVNLPSKGRVWLNNLPPSQATHSFLEVFAGPVAAGPQDWTVTVSAGTRFSAEYRAACVTYSGVGAAGGVTTVYGAEAGTSLALVAGSKAGRTVVVCFAHQATTAVTSFSGTHRYALDLGLTISEGVVGDTAGADTVTVTASRKSGAAYCGIALDLLPAVTELPARVAVTGLTPKVEVTTPPPTVPTSIPVLTLAPAVHPMRDTFLRGELFKPPYVPVKVPYVNIPLEVFANGGKKKLDTYLHRYVGRRILVVGYSEGAQVIYKWLREDGPTSDIDPSEVTFISVANPERKYGGIPGGGDYPGGEGGTGLPEDTPYKVIDIARQYDFWADHPTDTENAVAMRNVDPKGNGFGVGSPVHGDYTRVSPNPGHPMNFALTEGTVTYVWSPTYPAPIIDDADFFATTTALAPRDDVLRTEIEAAYDRPVTIPGPPPGRWDEQFPYGWDGVQWVRVSRSSVETPTAAGSWWLEEVA